VSRRSIVVIGAAGRVGSQIVAELLRQHYHVVLIDMLPGGALAQRSGRLLNDARLAVNACGGSLSSYGGVDALDCSAMADILSRENPDLVINYAIPITWDAAKRLPNYAAISAAGLGAFTPIQVLTPLKVAQAIHQSGIKTRYMVGNLPDITIPVINCIASSGALQPALCGAGNVGLNQIAMRHQAALELGANFEDVDIALVSHHLHWVAPREPGYSNEGPFLAAVSLAGEDISARFNNLRELMNSGVRRHYEADASFSSTTGILASQIAMALLDESGSKHQLHAPAPNGLPGGYPVEIQLGEIKVSLPKQWSLDHAIETMDLCHTLDGVASIGSDGTVKFTDAAQEILRDEVGFDLPSKMPPHDIETVAREQIDCMHTHFKKLV
jgi:NAD(P)-dependent dehydrogenase (short-subunit alcohol dehydrogenase family)